MSERHDRGDLPERGIVEDFFAQERATIEELPGHDLHWQGIVRARRTRRTRMVAALAAGAAAVVVGAATVAIWQGGGPDAEVAPAGQTSNTVQVPSPQDTTATSPDPTSAAPTAPDGFVVRSMTSGDATTRAVLGSDSCDGSACPVIQVTTDDGQQWRTMSALTGLSPVPQGGRLAGAATGPDQVGIVRMADPQTAWVAGSTIQRTTDGGQTWANYPYPGGTVVAMEVDGGTIRFVTADSCTSEGCRGPLTVYQADTSDPLAETEVLTVEAEVVTDVDLVTSGGVAFLAVDHDGGSTAHRLGETATEMTVCRDDGGLSLGVPAIAGDGVLTATCERPVDGGTEVSTTRSTDQGETWSQETRPTLIRGRVTALAQSSINDMVLVTDDATAGSGLYRTGDNGVSWDELVLPDDRRGPWTWAGAGGDDRVYAIPTGSGVYLESTDGGSSWREVDLG